MVAAAYNRLKPYATDSGLVGFDTLTTQFVDHDPALVDSLQLESPYETRWAFAAAPFRTETHVLNTVFSFPDGLMMRANGLADTVYVNFSDGMGERAITPNSVVSITWPDTGSYTIVTRVAKPGGGNLESQTVFKVSKTAVYPGWVEQQRVTV